MSPEPIDNETRNFILQNIESVTELELLLLLYAQPGEWNPDSVSRQMRTNPEAANKTMARLTNLGLLRQNANGGFECAPSPEMADLLEKLGQSYSQRRSSVIGLIYNKPTERMKDFADAFRIKKE